MVFDVFIHCDYVFFSKAIILEVVLIAHGIYNWENMIFIKLLLNNL